MIWYGFHGSFLVSQYDVATILVIELVANPGKSFDNSLSIYNGKLKDILPQLLRLQV